MYYTYWWLRSRLSDIYPRLTRICKCRSYLNCVEVLDGRNSYQLKKRGGRPINYQDKSLQCSDCGATFTFSAEEQQLFAVKGYNNEPKRCPSCRQLRKAKQFRNDDRGYGSERPMFPAVCSQCGKDTQVPFQPREDRPVYCRECYNMVKLGRPR